MSKIEAIQKQLTKLAEEKTKLNEKLNDNATKTKALTEELAQVQQTEKYAAAIINGLPTGTEVSFTYGRAESKRTLTGQVVAFKKTDTGTQYRLRVGSGFDEELLNVLDSAILAYKKDEIELSDPVVNTGPDAGEQLTTDPAALAALNA